MITNKITNKIGKKPVKINKTYSFPKDLVQRLKQVSRATGYSETDLIKMGLEKLFNE